MSPAVPDRVVRAVSRAAATLVATAGACVVLGWILDVNLLKGGVSSGITIKTNAGIALFLIGIATWLYGRDSTSSPPPPSSSSSKRLARLARVLATLAAALGGLTLFEHLTGIDLHIDQAIFSEPHGVAATASPNRMGPPACTCFLLAGGALLLLGRPGAATAGRRTNVAVALAIAIGVIALFPTLGYLYGAAELYGVAKYTGIALPTAVTFIVLAVGILCTRPANPVISLFTAASPGGVLVRRLLLPVILLPPLMGYARTIGERAGYYDAPFGRALLVMAFILAFSGLVWAAGRRLDAVDRARRLAADAESAAERARVLTEAKFHHLADNIPQLAWMADPGGEIVWFNRRWHDYCGTTPQQMAAPGAWHAAHDPAELPEVLARWRASVESGQPLDMTCALRGADGRFRPFLTRVMPLRDAAGHVVMWFGTGTDISDQRRVAQERQELLERERAARSQAERAVRLKDEFLATLSHELRTPLNAILGWSQLLESSAGLPADARDGVSIIYRNARAQSHLVEDLLDMSRITHGKLRVDVRDVVLADVVAAAVESVLPAARARRITIGQDLATAPACVAGDAARLQQVLWNLLNNAVKFTPEGGAIGVRLQCDHAHARVTVSDTGHGIHPDFLPHLFERFRQADASTTRKVGGLGLGLALARELVEMHGGTISAASAGIGRGAAFTITLPLSAAAAPVAATPILPARPVAGGAGLAGVQVLVVDDEPDARSLAKVILERCDARVATAASAAEALEAFRERAPDVLVSDIGMPEVDGYHFIGQVRALAVGQGGQVPAVALTAFAGDIERRRALLAGFQAHVAKPYDAAELVAVVTALAPARTTPGR